MLFKDRLMKVLFVFLYIVEKVIFICTKIKFSLRHFTYGMFKYSKTHRLKKKKRKLVIEKGETSLFETAHVIQNCSFWVKEAAFN